MAGPCLHCGKNTRTKMSFVDHTGKRIVYRCCMLGECANRLVDEIFNKKDQGCQAHTDNLDFMIDDKTKAFFD